MKRNLGGNFFRNIFSDRAHNRALCFFTGGAFTYAFANPDIDNVYDFFPTFKQNDYIFLSTFYVKRENVGAFEFAFKNLARYCQLQQGYLYTKLLKSQEPIISDSEGEYYVFLHSSSWLKSENYKLALSRLHGTILVNELPIEKKFYIQNDCNSSIKIESSFNINGLPALQGDIRKVDYTSGLKPRGENKIKTNIEFFFEDEDGLKNNVDLDTSDQNKSHEDINNSNGLLSKMLQGLSSYRSNNQSQKYDKNFDKVYDRDSPHETIANFPRLTKSITKLYKVVADDSCYLPTL